MAVQETSTGKRIPLGAYIEPTVHEQLRAVAQEQDRGVSAIVRRALDDYLQHQAEGAAS